MHPANNFFLFLLYDKVDDKNVAHASSTATTNVLSEWKTLSHQRHTFGVRFYSVWCASKENWNEKKVLCIFDIIFCWQSWRTETVQTNQKYYYVCTLHKSCITFIEKKQLNNGYCCCCCCWIAAEKYFRFVHRKRGQNAKEQYYRFLWRMPTIELKRKCLRTERRAITLAYSLLTVDCMELHAQRLLSLPTYKSLNDATCQKLSWWQQRKKSELRENKYVLVKKVYCSKSERNKTGMKEVYSCI